MPMVNQDAVRKKLSFQDIDNADSKAEGDKNKEEEARAPSKYAV